MKTTTAAQYEEYLNEIEQFDYDSEEWIIGGKNRVGQYYGRYGSALRKYDPIAFQVGLQEWNRV